jgi:hypothetical protein
MMNDLFDSDDGVVVRPTRPKLSPFVLFPVIITAVVLLAAWLWQPTVDVSPLVRPPMIEAGAPVPEVVTSVAQGQVVGAEAFWDGYRLDSGWHLAQAGDYGRYTFIGSVSNIQGEAGTARLLVQVRVAERNIETMMCRVTLEAGDSKPLICADTHHASYTSRWSRITISAA